MKRIILIFIVGLIAISGVSCTVKHEETAYLERVEDWVNSLNFAVVGLRIEDYQNTKYSKNQVMAKASGMLRYMLQWHSDIEATTPPSELEDVHRQVENLAAEVIEYTNNLLQVLPRDDFPLFHLRSPNEPYSMEVGNIFSDLDRISKHIRELKTVITTQKGR